MSNKGGRPLLFKTNEELQSKIDAYFEYCDENKQPYTISELALFLETDRATLIRYGERDEFYNTIKKAKQRVESQFEKRSLMGEYNSTIAIFLMKNNFGYKDKVDLNVESVEEDAISKALRESVTNGNKS